MIRLDVFPSPYGLQVLAIRSYSFWSVNKYLVSSYTLSRSVPINFTVPAFTASGLSVVLRRTNTGLPKDGDYS